MHFIRCLNELTPVQMKEMQKLNPKTPDEIEEERQDEEFLRGAVPAPVPGTKPGEPAHVHQH